MLNIFALKHLPFVLNNIAYKHSQTKDRTTLCTHFAARPIFSTLPAFTVMKTDGD